MYSQFMTSFPAHHIYYFPPKMLILWNSAHLTKRTSLGCHGDPVQCYFPTEPSHLFFTLPNQIFPSWNTHNAGKSSSRSQTCVTLTIIVKLYVSRSSFVVFFLLEVGSTSCTLWFVEAMQVYYVIRS